MTNFEFYKERIESVGFNFALTEDEGITKCSINEKCGKCIYEGACITNRFKWLYEEYIEKPTLTPNERKFCEITAYKYLAREEGGRLFAYDIKPVKRDGVWHSGLSNMLVADRRFKGCDFDFIKWEDDEPWAVEELLELEVAE